MTDLLQKELKAQEERAIEMGGHLRNFAETFDLQDDEERHRLRRVAAAFIEEQTKYEYMKLQAASQNPPQSPFNKGGSEAGGFAGAAA